ncbi:MAG: DUF2828 family protein [Solobacterium sp.]|nr:DUF2828 family protein [Solobacterium sp.]
MHNTENLVQGLMTGQAMKVTENGASALDSALAGSLLDLFAMAGSLRTRPQAAVPVFRRAMAEDRLLAAKLAFYTRDIRGGLGERDTARVMFRTMADMDPEAMRKNLHLIAEYGRYDDLADLLDSRVKDDVLALLHEQLKADILAMKEGRPVSLLAKWLPSVNTSSSSSRRKARRIAQAFGFSEREYRKTLSALRSYLNVTEVRLTEKAYDEIRYEAVPSLAMHRYGNAFSRHDEKRFGAYLAKVQEGRSSIHADTLYPYDIVRAYCGENIYDFFSFQDRVPQVNPVLEAQWKALPDYLEKPENCLVMVDISGSMYGLPICTSVGLGIYFAQRNKGAFCNRIMLFAERPQLVELKGETLRDQLVEIASLDPGYNTDLEAAFELVLKTAVRLNLPQEELPERIIIISDNEIDCLRRQTDWLFADEMKRRFEKAGYKMPSLVLWNVDSRQNTFHARGDAENVILCSGQAASVFKNLIGTLQMSPYEYMIHVLNNPRYDAVTV